MFRRTEQRAKRIQDYVIERLRRKEPQWTLEKLLINAFLLSDVLNKKGKP